jgi:rhomboid protease GluP
MAGRLIAPHIHHWHMNMPYLLEIAFMSDSEPERPRHPLEAPTHQEQDIDSRQEALRTGRMVRVVWREASQPWLTWLLLASIVLIFSVYFINRSLYNDMIEAGGVLWSAVVRRGEWWRLITHMFLHLDVGHLAMNGLSLYFLGQMREKNDGHVRFLLLYVLSGLAGGLLQLLLGEHNVLGVGASGAIFGLAGAELVFLWRHQKYMGAGARAAWMQLLGLLALQLMIGFAAGGEVIGNWAHMGGLLMGLAWAWIYGPFYIIPPQIPEKDKDGVGMVHAQDTLPLSGGRLWGLFLLIGVLIGMSLLLKLRA